MNVNSRNSYNCYHLNAINLSQFNANCNKMPHRLGCSVCLTYLYVIPLSQLFYYCLGLEKHYF